MRKRIAVVVVLALCAASLAGCYGNFALTKKLYAVNGKVGDRFLRSAVTWAFVIVPVYGTAALVDFVALNTIEFWSGDNPIAAGTKDFEYAEGDRKFDVHAVKSGDSVSYDIRQYERGTYVDSLTVKWDLRTGTSLATHRGQNAATGYVATVRNDLVLVETVPPGGERAAVARIQ